ncbi:MAG: PSD1 and planctomycete cytochrome C domain-containing protein, partial [Phycisphaerae bacterium]|nr:PSD1 and planctomycete cytochrome C domain-containing protein [Phycisphaerae bacterium]
MNWGFITILLFLAVAGSPPAAIARDIDFDRDIRPILADTCYACHGPDGNKRKAKLRLDQKNDVFADRDGLHVVVPGKLADSEIWRRITSADPDERMPPKKATRQLNQRQIQLIRRWVEQGAAWSQHWAFVPPKRHEPPQVKQGDWPRNAIDPFVLARLERESLAPSPVADKPTLIRRVTLDLTGLPPTPAQVAAFESDDSSGAYEQVVDRLLESPRYGEHMAAYWLDSARYADTDGYQNDRYRYQWVWRDWVIMALNDNMPFDQFVIEQLAGDMLPNATLKQQIATGFCRNHRINSEAGSIPAEWHVENLVDRVDTLGTVFLGLTIQCARCHDHKYDPITQKEYYQLFAYFNNVPESGVGPNNGNSPPFIQVPKSWPNLSSEQDKLIVPGKLEFQKGAYGGGVVRPKPGKPNTVMVMHEMKKPRPTWLLKRGVYNMPDKSQLLKPGVPASTNPMTAPAPGNRLELARWLVHPSNPLLTRVTMNRFWQRFFGVGLVRTSENFGSQGEPPSHPKLLDWLATEFIDRDWDVKSLHKLIVMSATYRQSSRLTERLKERDPENRLLTRGPRYRLSAFQLRDQALFAG